MRCCASDDDEPHCTLCLFGGSNANNPEGLWERVFQEDAFCRVLIAHRVFAAVDIYSRMGLALPSRRAFFLPTSRGNFLDLRPALDRAR